MIIYPNASRYLQVHDLSVCHHSKNTHTVTQTIMHLAAPYMLTLLIPGPKIIILIHSEKLESTPHLNHGRVHTTWILSTKEQ